MGRPERAGATAVALGGTRGAGLGDALDGAFNPAALLRGPVWDAVLTAGQSRYARDELQRVVSGPDARRRVTNAAQPVGAAAFAYRRSWFALGAFAESVSRIDHAVTVDRVRRLGSSTTATLFEQATESFSIEALRVGASVAVRVPGDVMTVGASLHGRRVVAAHDSSGVYTSVGRTTESYGVWRNLTVRGWGPGATLGAVVDVHPNVSLAVRYVHESAVPAVLIGTTDASTQITGLFVRRFDVSLDAPDELQAGFTARAGSFRIFGEAGVVLAAGTFRDPDRPCTTSTPGPFVLPVTRLHNCWNLLTPDLHEVRMPTFHDVRLGVERRWRRGRWVWTARGGGSLETAPVLRPDPTDPDEPDPFVPLEGARLRWHAGAGMDLGRFVVDLGASRWQEQYRVLIDMRWRGR